MPYPRTATVPAIPTGEGSREEEGEGGGGGGQNEVRHCIHDTSTPIAVTKHATNATLTLT